MKKFQSIEMHWGNFKYYKTKTGIWYSNEKIMNLILKYYKEFYANGIGEGSIYAFTYPTVNEKFIAAFAALWQLKATAVVLDMAENCQEKLLANNKITRFLPLDLLIHISGFEKGDLFVPFAKKCFDLNENKWIPTAFDQQSYNSLAKQKNIENYKNFKIAGTAKNGKNVGLMCTSSGTLNKAKTVMHDRDFIEQLSYRNVKLFDLNNKNILNIYSFNHGSSFAVLFFPSLLSFNCNLFSNFGIDYLPTSFENAQNLVRQLYDKNINLFIAYSHEIPFVLEACKALQLNFNNRLKILTMHYIQKSYIDALQNHGIDMVSVFGCSETSGPIFIKTFDKNHYNTKEHFNETVFEKVDNFYHVKINDANQLVVSNDFLQDFVMEDSFEKINEKLWIHHGRKSLHRIFDVEFNISDMIHLPIELGFDGFCIPDFQKQKFWLVLWKKYWNRINDYEKLSSQQLLSIVNNINNAMKSKFSDKFFINDVDILNIDDFLYGIKVDIEAVRNHFRRKNQC